MFIDASAIVAIIANESDRDVLVGKLKLTKHRSVSPIVVFEAVLALKRIKSKTYDEVLAIVDEFLKIYAIKKMTMIDFTITKDALGAVLSGDTNGHATEGWPTFADWPAPSARGRRLGAVPSARQSAPKILSTWFRSRLWQPATRSAGQPATPGKHALANAFCRAMSHQCPER